MSDRSKRGALTPPQVTQSNASPRARADRLRRLRKMTQKSRKAFAATYHISPGTIQNWETARFGGLTEKGAKLMIYALKKEGIHASFEWLMYGAGAPPAILQTKSLIDDTLRRRQRAKKQICFSDALKIELEKFYQLHMNAAHMVIQDDSMAPRYHVGQIVAGLMLQGDHVASLIGKTCIIDTHEHGRMVREIWPGTQPGRFHLLAVNHQPNQAGQASKILTNIEIIRAARVIWIRQDDLAD